MSFNNKNIHNDKSINTDEYVVNDENVQINAVVYDKDNYRKDDSAKKSTSGYEEINLKSYNDKEWIHI